MKRTDVVALDPKEPDAGANVSHDCVEAADQLSVLFVGPVFLTTTAWLDVAVAPCGAVKESEVEVVICRMAGFLIFTVSDAVDVLFDVSVDNAQRVVEPFERPV